MKEPPFESLLQGRGLRCRSVRLHLVVFVLCNSSSEVTSELHHPECWSDSKQMSTQVKAGVVAKLKQRGREHKHVDGAAAITVTATGVTHGCRLVKSEIMIYVSESVWAATTTGGCQRVVRGERGGGRGGADYSSYQHWHSIMVSSHFNFFFFWREHRGKHDDDDG